MNKNFGPGRSVTGMQPRKMEPTDGRDMGGTGRKSMPQHLRSRRGKRKGRRY